MQEQATATDRKSLLATGNINKLIFKFALPSIVALLVSGIYNIADQIFVGNSVGENGLSAMTYAMPLTTLCTAISLLLGVGTASCFNLQQGKGNREKAANIAGNGIALMLGSGTVLAALVLIFLKPITLLMGADGIVLDYLRTYISITALGVPFLIFSISFSNIIRSDGSPAYAMICTMSGAVVDMALNAIFIFGLHWGIQGAAWSTVIGQCVAAIMAFLYLFRLKSFKLKREYFLPKFDLIKSMLLLGIAAFINQVAIMAMQLVLNTVLTSYGGIDGKTLVAAFGAALRFNVIVMAFVIGTAQGCQPIIGYNYGAKNYARVKRTYFTGAAFVMFISAIAFAAFQIIPKPIIMIFGRDEFSNLYFDYGVRVFRIFMFLVFLNGLQPMTSNFFTSIGKAYKGMALSLTRQIVFLIPLLLILPKFFGVDGLLFSGPIADAAAFMLATALIIFEMRKIIKLQKDFTEEQSSVAAA